MFCGVISSSFINDSSLSNITSFLTLPFFIAVRDLARALKSLLVLIIPFAFLPLPSVSNSAWIKHHRAKPTSPIVTTTSRNLPKGNALIVWMAPLWSVVLPPTPIASCTAKNPMTR